jgi:uncharacterized protein DUF2760
MAFVLALMIGATGAAAQFWLLVQLGVAVADLPVLAGVSLALPLLASALTLLLRPAAPSAPEAPALPVDPPVPSEPPEHTALRLLAFLQEEGRLVDFLTEDVSPYSDEQIGAATRGIHASCAKALREVVTLERVMTGTEDESVTLEPGFDAAAIRLTGNVSGQPPFHGTLRHAGWRASHVAVPARAGADPFVVAPAEVEIG